LRGNEVAILENKKADPPKPSFFFSARTIADFEGMETIGMGHIAEAIQYRTLNRTTS